MTPAEAAFLFEVVLLRNGAGLFRRDPAWLDYSEPANVFTRDL